MSSSPACSRGAFYNSGLIPQLQLQLQPQPQLQRTSPRPLGLSPQSSVVALSPSALLTSAPSRSRWRGRESVSPAAVTPSITPPPSPFSLPAPQLPRSLSSHPPPTSPTHSQDLEHQTLICLLFLEQLRVDCVRACAP